MESEVPAGSPADADTLRLASDTAGATSSNVSDVIAPGLPAAEAASPHRGDATTDFQLGSRPPEFFGLPSDFTPGMSVKSAPANLVGTDKLVLRGFVVQPRGSKSEFPPDYTLVSGPFMGGMGKVFRARQGSLRRDVAIKQIHDELRSNDEERKKFVTEAIITGELEHPNIIPIHDLGFTKDFAQSGDQLGGNDADLFYTMKFVEGDDWKEELPKLSEAENIDVLLKVADAISFAHSRNIIHRDLKPSNIRLGKFGEVLVMDWGLAVRLDSPERFPPAGTPMYMAPEMAIEFLQLPRNQILKQLGAGRSSSRPAQSAVGKHSDIYLLGALLFQVVTQRAPHPGRTGRECIQNAAKNEIAPTDVQGELLDIALKAMATDPQDRYASVAEFQHAIRSYKSHVESISLADQADADARSAEQLSGNGKKHAKQVYDLFSSARYGFRSALKIWSNNQRARERLRQTEQLFAETAYTNDDFDLALSLLDPANPDQQALHEQVTRSANERSQRDKKLKRLRQALFAVVTLAFVVTSVLLAVWKNAYDNNVALHGDNEQLKSTKAGLEQSVQVLRTEVGTANQERDHANQAKEAAVKAAETAGNRAQDAEQKATVAEQKSALADRVAASSIYRAAFQSALAGLLDNGPKKALAALGTITSAPDGEADWEWHRLFHLANWQRSAQPFGGEAESTHLVGCSADADRLVTAGNRNGAAVVNVWDAAEGIPRLLRTYEIPNGNVLAVSISADGRWAAAGLDSSSAGLAVWDVQSTSRQPTFLVGRNRSITAIAFSPQPPELVAGDSAGNVDVWRPQVGQLAPARSYPGHIWGTVRSVAFSADGKFVVTAGTGERVNVYEPSTNNNQGWPIQLELAVSNPEVSAVAFLPLDPSRIVCSCSDGSIYLCDWFSQAQRAELRPGDWTGARPTPLEHHLGAVRGLAFGRNSKTLITCGEDQHVSLWNVEQTGDSLRLRRRISQRIHDAPVASCSISHDGRYAFSADTSGVAYRWDLALVDDFWTIPPSRGGDGTNLRPIHSASLAPNGRAGESKIVVGDGAGFVRVVDGSQPAALSELHAGHLNHAGMTAYYMAGPNPRIVTSTPDGTICAWNVQTGALERRVNLLDGTVAAGANVVTVSPDGRYAVGAANNVANGGQLSAAWWDVTRDQPSPLDLGNHSVSALAVTGFDSRGVPQLLAGQKFGQLLMWNGRWHELVSPPNRPHRGTIADIVVHAGEFAYVVDLGLTVEATKMISKWSLRGAAPSFDGAAYQLPAAGNTADIRLKLSRNGNTLGAIQVDDAGRIVGVRVLDTRDLQPVAAAEQDGALRNAHLLDVAISPNGQVMLGIANGNRLKEWNPQAHAWQPHASAEKLRAVAAELRNRNSTSGLRRIEFIDETRLLAYGDGIALEWKLDTGQLLNRVQSRAPIEVAAVVPGTNDDVATIAADGRYARWRQSAGHTNFEVVNQQFLVDHGYARAVVSPDASRALLAAAEFGGRSSSLEFVELATGTRTPITTIRGRALAMAWSGSGQRVAVAYSDAKGSHVAVFDANTRQAISDNPWELPEQPSCIALDQIGDNIAVGADDKAYFATESNWSAFAPSMPLGHRVSSVAFSPSGRRLVIGCENGDILLRAIELADGNGTRIERAVMALSGHDAEITQLGFGKFEDSNVDVLVSGDIHGKTLVHLTSGEAPPINDAISE
jgi:serine/threonine protein kinase/WD40 repeat protein